MAKDRNISRETLIADAENFVAGEFSKTNMTINWMDNYVAKIQPNKVDEWIKVCCAIPEKTRTDGKIIKDEKAIREVFIATFFPDQTEEAKKKAKEAKKALREAEKAKKEAMEKLSPAERLRIKLADLSKEEE